MNKKDTKILVVDDDRRLRELLSNYLQSNGFLVETAKNALDAEKKFAEAAFDLLVIDRMMPGKNGTELVMEIRKDSDIPVLMLTAMGEANDRISGFESGADDYLSKPFEPKELLLRIGSILKRVRKPTKIVFGNFLFNMENGDLYKGDEFINLSSSELKLLQILLENIDKPLTRLDLSGKLNNISERSVDVQVTRLRKKIEDDPKNPLYLQSAWGIGYILRSRS